MGWCIGGVIGWVEILFAPFDNVVELRFWCVDSHQGFLVVDKSLSDLHFSEKSVAYISICIC